jgi:peptidyl-prolyl cis-trans isomerase C
MFPDITVNGTAIAQADIAAEAQNHNAPASKPGWAWKAAARALTVRELLRQEAARRDLAPAPRDLGAGRHETPEEATIRLLLEQEIAADAPSTAELRAIYEARPERFQSPDLFEAAHILYAADPDDIPARDKARAQAHAAIAALTRDPGAFSRMAAEDSACGSRGAGGHLGQLAPGDTVPEFEAAMVALTPGQMAAAPVETRYGIHVLRLDAHAKGAHLPFEAVEDSIREGVERARWARGAKGFVQRLIDGATIAGVSFEAA